MILLYRNETKELWLTEDFNYIETIDGVETTYDTMPEWFKNLN